MKKFLATTVLATCLLSTVLQAREKADTTYWKGNGTAGINLSQVSLTHWSAGGDPAIAMDAFFNYESEFKKAKHLWQNRIELAYGLNKIAENGTKKTNDKIYLSSTYGYAIAKSLYLSTLISFNSQFANGYNYDVSRTEYISRFMAPGYVLVGEGLLWTPKKWFTATFTPFTWRGTFVCSSRLSNEGAFGVKKGKNLLSEFGGNLKLEFNYEFLPNMNVYSRLDFYSDYLHDPQNIDIRWDIQLNMKINKWFAANLNMNMIYDNDILIADKNGHKAPRFQFKEVLGVGFQVSF